MRAQIIFRGLTLFTFEKGSVENAKDGDNMGELTAWLVSDPKMKGMPAHEHVPSLATLARESFAGTGRARVNREFPEEMRLSLPNHGLANGVTVAGSFLDYVPRLGALHRDKPTGIQQEFITRKIVIPSGRVRAREFVAWESYGKAPARVAFMDTPFQGYSANEVVVDIGDDDSESIVDDQKKHMVMEAGAKKKRFWSFTKGSQLSHDIQPNTVEVLITNAAARRATSVFWGLHMLTLFDAAGYPRRDAYENTEQFDAFVRAANDFDPTEWQMDRDHMGIGHPFPFLAVDSTPDQLRPIRDAGAPYIIPKAPPHPEGEANRKPKSAPPGHGMDGMGGMHGHPANDPLNVMICPPGVI